MIYEYFCNFCKHSFEASQSIKDNALEECPKCHNKTLEKMISVASGHLFKGKGLNKGYHSTFAKSDKNV